MRLLLPTFHEVLHLESSRGGIEKDMAEGTLSSEITKHCTAGIILRRHVQSCALSQNDENSDAARQFLAFTANMTKLLTYMTLS